MNAKTREILQLLAYLSWYNEDPGWTEDMRPHKPEALFDAVFQNCPRNYNTIEAARNTLYLALSHLLPTPAAPPASQLPLPIP